ncbi:hypothetical protein GC173_00540 [bacterium]|nr:hypothetical protein [bacterium]
MRRFTATGLSLLSVLVLSLGCGGSGEPPPPSEKEEPTITPTPAPTPVELIVTGQVVLGAEPGPGRVVSVELHDADLRQRVFPLVQSMLQLSERIRDRKQLLREIREQMALVRSQRAEQERLEAEVKELAELAQPQAEKLAVAQRTLAYYEQVRKDFVRLGPAKMPVRDPITGAEFTLSALAGQKENSLALIDARSAKQQEIADEASAIVAELTEKANDHRVLITRIDSLINELDVPAKRAAFVDTFLELRQAARQLSEAEALVLRARDNSRARAVSLTDEKGVFRMETTHVDGVLLVTHTVELQGADGTGSMNRLLWMLPVDGATSPIASLTLTEANATLNAPVESLTAWSQRQNDTESVIRGIADSYINLYPEPTGDGVDWIDTMLR